MSFSLRRWAVLASAAALAGAFATPAGAQSVMQQCGQQYQAAKAANTLNGMSWNQFRSECATRLKATPAAATTPAVPATPAVAAAPAPAPAPANPLKPVAPVAPAAKPAVAPAATPAVAPAAPAATPMTTAGGKPMSAGRAAFVTRERQCGTEWKANKVTLVAQTPGLTWPKYLSQCNTRLKAAGQ